MPSLLTLIVTAVRSALPPQSISTLLRMRWHLAALDVEKKLLRLELALKANFDPNQPRVPAGWSPRGGKWTRVDGYARETDIPQEPATDSSSTRERRRRDFVLRGGGSRFRIAPNPNADSSAPWYELPLFSTVSDHSAEIDLVADEVGINVDLIRTIMYMETTHGHYFLIGPLADQLGASNSILPMNINVSVWGRAFRGRSELNIPLNNIRADATILRGRKPAARSLGC